jgi:surface antigen
MSARRGTGVLARRSRACAVLAIAAAAPMLAGPQASAQPQASARPPAAVSSASWVVCTGYAGCARRGHSDHGYPRHATASYWRMTAGNECTNYVAYVEARVFHARRPRYLLGNAGQWAATAAAHGVVVNHVPSRGAVAEWDGGAPGMGPEGHVAVVERVGRRGRYIIISQQHVGSDRNGYDWTRINAGFPARDWQEWPDHFLHFRHGQRHHRRHRRHDRPGGPAAGTRG